MSDPSDAEVCAACGKSASAGALKKCAACHLVQYCSVKCQRAHRPSHKKACRRRAAEMHEEKLFALPPPPDDCPVCMLPLPTFTPMRKYQACCGKILCMGCCVGQGRANGGFHGRDIACPYCREKAPMSDENIADKMRIRAELGDSDAYVMLGDYYGNGSHGVTKNETKAFDLFTKGAQLGSIQGHYSLGTCYQHGIGTAKNDKKAIHHFEKAAIGGCVESRFCLGEMTVRGASEVSEALYIRDFKRSMDHLVIGAKMGHKGCMKRVNDTFKFGEEKKWVHEGFGYIDKEKLEEVKRAYIASIEAARSKDRDLMATVFRQSGDYPEHL